MASIHEVLGLEQIDQDVFRGPVIKPVLQHIFGDQVAGQLLVATTHTAGSTSAVSSLHAYLVDPGCPHIPTMYMVKRIHDDRFFCHRLVEAMQGDRTTFVMQVNSHRKGDEGLEHSDAMCKVSDPENVVTNTFEMTNTRRLLVRKQADWDTRVVLDDQFEHDKYIPSRQLVRFRCGDRLPDNETFRVCTLAYMSDMTLLSPTLVPHPGAEVQEASLDHAM